MSNAKQREEQYLRDKAKEESDIIAAFKRRLREKVRQRQAVNSVIRSITANARAAEDVEVLKLLDETH